VSAAAGFAVQLLALSVDHQRYYFERSFEPYFWLDERTMYRDSPLLARPGELLAVIRGDDLDGVRALVPSHHPMSMTSVVFGPPEAQLPEAPRWMRQYLLFLVPRPWPLWSRYLPEEMRPVPAALLTRVGLIGAIAAFGLLAVRLRGGRPEDELALAQAEEAQ